jgi:hypothetical protein
MLLNEVGQCFSVLRRPAGLSTGKMGCVLKFTVKEIDPSTGEAEEEGYEDEYQVRTSRCEFGGVGGAACGQLMVKEMEPSTGEVGEEGYEDEYQVRISWCESEGGWAACSSSL